MRNGAKKLSRNAKSRLFGAFGLPKGVIFLRAVFAATFCNIYTTECTGEEQEFFEEAK